MSRRFWPAALAAVWLAIVTESSEGNDVVEASIRVSVLRTEVSAEGKRMRRFHDLRLDNQLIDTLHGFPLGVEGRYSIPNCCLAAGDIRLWLHGGSQTNSTRASLMASKVMILL